MQIAMVQHNPLLGDCVGNAQAIFQAARNAHQQGASLLLTPELSFTASRIYSRDADRSSIPL
jgi:predicted amidohydrolase